MRRCSGQQGGSFKFIAGDGNTTQNFCERWAMGEAGEASDG